MIFNRLDPFYSILFNVPFICTRAHKFAVALSELQVGSRACSRDEASGPLLGISWGDCRDRWCAAETTQPKVRGSDEIEGEEPIDGSGARRHRSTDELHTSALCGRRRIATFHVSGHEQRHTL